jgi:hypothetical protein
LQRPSRSFFGTCSSSNPVFFVIVVCSRTSSTSALFFQSLPRSPLHGAAEFDVVCVVKYFGKGESGRDHRKLALVAARQKEITVVATNQSRNHNQAYF